MKPLDPDVAAIVAASQDAGVRPLHELGVDGSRELVARSPQPPAPAMREITDHQIDGPHGPLTLRAYHPHGDAPSGEAAIVYFHGGGMIMGTLDSFDAFARNLADTCSATVVSVDYRLAPEHTYPVATDEAWAAVVWVHRNAQILGIDPAKIAVAGDSAGGSLAAGATLRARDEGEPELAAQLLFYPGLERVRDRPSMTEFADGPMLTRADVEWMKNLYLGPDEEKDTAFGVPSLADDLSNLPDAIVVSAEVDVLRDAVEDYGQRLRDAGVPTALLRYPGVCHGFMSQAGWIARADTAFAEVGALFRLKVQGEA